MLTLAILRHAKSSWSDPSLSDHERPLNRRGMKDAPLMGRWLAENDLSPALALGSSARRARQTLELCLGELETKPDTRHDEKLYHAGEDRIRRIISHVGGAPSPLLVVGHNPGLNILALDLAAQGGRDEISRLEDNLPTAGLVMFELPIGDWSEIMSARGRLVHFITPKIIKAKK
jgi:phosphohistidine phosphatase